MKVPKGKSWLGGSCGRIGDQAVELKEDFFIGKYEVTQGEWQKITGKNPSVYSPTGVNKNAVKDVSDAELARFPVETVSWDDCQKFLKKLNGQAKESGWEYRLPKKAEWEYACRGGPMTDRFESAYDFYLERPSNTLFPDQDNFGNVLKRTSKVGSFRPNRLGLHDMHGNVWEWCDDTFQIANGELFRCGKGGWWRTGPEAGRAVVQRAHRSTFTCDDLGFRVARVPIGKELIVLQSPVQKAPPQAQPSHTNALGMEFVRVPKGKSWLGGGGGKLGDTAVTCTEDFYLGRFEVTQAEWEKVTGSNPSRFSRTGSRQDAVKEISDADLKRFPVEQVSWNDAKLFTQLLNSQAKESGWEYRLPTEKEWEYACRGGPMANRFDSLFDFYFDSPTDQLQPDLANFGRQLGRTCKVGSYRPNRLGLFDMHGNEMEWCSDTKKAADGSLLAAYRGAGWNHDTTICRAAFHGEEPPTVRWDSVGLRVARVPVGKTEVVVPMPISNTQTLLGENEPSAKIGPLDVRDFRPSQDGLGSVSNQPEKVGVNQWVDLLAWSEGVNWEPLGYNWNQYLSTPPSRQGIRLNGLPQARFPIPAVIDGSFELEVEFERRGAHDVCIFFPVGLHNLELAFAAWQEKGGIDGLNWINGATTESNPASRRPTRVRSNQKHRVFLQVKHKANDRVQINVDLDESKNYIAWEGPTASLVNHTPDNGIWNISTIQRVWLGSFDAPTTFSKLRVRMLTGSIRKDSIGETDRQNDRAKGLIRLVGERPQRTSVGSSIFAVNQIPASYGGMWIERLWPFVAPNCHVCTDYYGAHAPSRLKVPIPRGAKTFTAYGENQSSRDASFLVEVDGKKMYESPATELARITVKIPEKATSMELVIDPLGDVAWDHTYWCYPRFHSVTEELVTEEMRLKTTNSLLFEVSSNSVGWGTLTRNEPIQMPLSGAPIHVEDVIPCSEFLYAAASSSISYQIPTGMNRFTAVGYNMRSRLAKFEVWADGKRIFESPTAGIIPINVKLPPESLVLELKVDSLGDNAWDHTMWCYPRLHRK